MKKFSDLSDLIEKSGNGRNGDDVLKGRFQVKKSDDEKMLAFGWESVAVRVDGKVVIDWQKDIIEPRNWKTQHTNSFGCTGKVERCMSAAGPQC